MSIRIVIRGSVLITVTGLSEPIGSGNWCGKRISAGAVIASIIDYGIIHRQIDPIGGSIVHPIC
jgi:hypothetical protein